MLGHMYLAPQSGLPADAPSAAARPRRGARPLRRQQGFMILLAVFLVALVALTLAATVPAIIAQIRRDKEVEMIHRGVQYARAIKKYSRKTSGGYPTTIEQLLETNHIKFLRQRYKDPITGKDFRLVHQGDPQLTAVMTGLPIQGGNPFAPQSPNAPGQPSASPSPTPAPADAQPSPSPSSTPTEGSSGSTPGGQTFGGGPIVGVASISKKKAFHIFNKKDHYNDWLFMYSSQLMPDILGVLIKTPFNGIMTITPGIAGGTTLNGQPASGQSSTSGAGSGGSSFGPSGFGGSGNTNSFGGGGFGAGGNTNPSSQPQQ
jgi:type II secretory pathway pseudopilin PulG